MANNLKFIRNRLGLSQDRAAELMGTTRNQITKLESGSRRLSSEWINRAAKAFGVDPGDLVTDNPLTPPTPLAPTNSDLAPYLRPFLVHMFQAAGFERLKAEEWTTIAIAVAEGAQAEGRLPTDQEVSMIVTASLRAQSADRRPKQ